MLVDKIYQNLKKNIQSNKSKSILLAISGGIDSVVLLDVLDKIKNRYELLSDISLVFIDYIANPNCSHRAELCLDLSKRYKYPLVIRKSYLGSKNFESNARNERYQYFNQISEINKIDFILTAHHKDDQTETLLMKYYDNSDWISYLGIREKYNKIIRPMLNISKNEISSYAKEVKLYRMACSGNFFINTSPLLINSSNLFVSKRFIIIDSCFFKYSIFSIKFF